MDARARKPALAVLVVAAILAATTPGQAASSSTVVGVDVVESTILNMTACTGTDLSLGPMTVTATSITPTDCQVTFGSSNASSTLRLMQRDERGAAMSQSTTVPVVHRASPQLWGVAAKSATEAWVAGFPGKTGDASPLAHTTDGGATWTDQTSCVAGASFYDVSYVTADTVVAAGGSNVVCRTDDGGATWTTSVPSPAGIWRALDMLPSGEGWISGSSGRLATTTDSGATWTSLPVIDASYTVHRIHAASSTRLYAVATATGSPPPVYALTSDDGGATWSSFLIGNTIGAGWARTVVATSATTAFAGSAYGIHRTTDSGATWTQVDATSSMCLVALDASTIISYYRPGFVPRRTTNGGTTWSNVPNPPDLTGMARGCSAGDATTAFMSGYNDQRLVTTDAADTHVLWPTPYRDQNGIDAWSAARFVSVGDGGTIRRSIDGGTVVTARTSGTVETLQDVEAFGDQVEVAVAVGDGGTIRRSIDGGASWVGVAGGTTSDLAGIDRAQDGALLVVGDAGTVRRSFNDGATWHALTAPAATNLYDVVAMSRDDVWVVGDGGQIYRTTNGGTTWTSQTSGTALRLLAIDSIDGQTAIATSNIDGSQQTAIARTNNGGATWTTTMTTGPGSNYSDDVRYLDPTTIIIGGAAEYRKSVDGGATWTEHVSTAAAINAIGAIDGNTFLIAGSNDGISAVVPGAEVADFALGTADFSTLVGGFGACLQTAVATTTTAWPVAGLGNCTAGNLTQWRGVSNDPLAATVASRATPGTAVVTFHFGMRPAATQAVGDYRADLRFEVIAPQA